MKWLQSIERCTTMEWKTTRVKSTYKKPLLHTVAELSSSIRTKWIRFELPAKWNEMRKQKYKIIITQTQEFTCSTRLVTSASKEDKKLPLQWRSQGTNTFSKTLKQNPTQNSKNLSLKAPPKMNRILYSNINPKKPYYITWVETPNYPHKWTQIG